MKVVQTTPKGVTPFDPTKLAASLGVDLNAIPADKAEQLRESVKGLLDAASSQTEINIRATYWMLPKKMWSTLAAAFAFGTALLMLAVAVLNWINHTEIEATKHAQEAVGKKIGSLAVDGSVERIRQAAEDTKKGGVLDRLALTEAMVKEIESMTVAQATSGVSGPGGKNIIYPPSGTTDDWEFLAVAEDYGRTNPDNLELRRTGIVWQPLADKTAWRVTAQSESGTAGAMASSFRCLMVRKNLIRLGAPAGGASKPRT